jgi:hypothetical protein
MSIGLIVALDELNVFNVWEYSSLDHLGNCQVPYEDKPVTEIVISPEFSYLCFTQQGIRNVFGKYLQFAISDIFRVEDWEICSKTSSTQQEYFLSTHALIKMENYLYLFCGVD